MRGLWCANLTLGQDEATNPVHGYSGAAGATLKGGLAPATFTLESERHTVESLRYTRTGGNLVLDRDLPAGAYILLVGEASFRLSAGGSHPVVPPRRAPERPCPPPRHNLR